MSILTKPSIDPKQPTFIEIGPKDRVEVTAIQGHFLDGVADAGQGW